VRQQDAYPANIGWACSYNYVLQPAPLSCLLKTTKINGGVECRWCMKNRDSRLCCRSLLDRRVSSTFRRSSRAYSTWASSVSRYEQVPPCHASVNLVYYTNRRRYTEDKLSKYFWLPIWRPLKVSPPKVEKLWPWHSSTIMQNFTPIGGTVVEISVIGHRKREKELQQI